MPKMIKDVVGALIANGGKYLVAKRKPNDTFGNLWEFPGGTVEKGETREHALAREIKEELGVDIEVGLLLLELDDEIPTLKINICLFEAKITNGVPRPIECQDVRWANIGQLKDLELAPADKKVLKWLEGVYEKS